MKSMLMVAGLLLASALAGCSGDDGGSDVASVSTSTQTNLGNTTLSGSISASPNGTAGGVGANGTDGNLSMAWSYDNRSGTVSGTGTVVNVPITKDESFTVSNGTAQLVVNVTAQGHAVTVSLRPPDCEETACAAESAELENEQASFTAMKPDEGAWTVSFELEGVGPVEADYTLSIAQQVPGA